jgi:hypothetical protein
MNRSGPFTSRLKLAGSSERTSFRARSSRSSYLHRGSQVANNHEKTWTTFVQWTSESNHSRIQALPTWLTAKLDDPNVGSHRVSFL